jgi:MarR family transcriptional regulator, 2-MHQ and catechol-resistance regulon repressor
MSRHVKKIQPGEDFSGTHLWLVLWKAFEAAREYAVRNIDSLGLGLSDFAILEVLLHKGPCAVNDIGGRVGLTSGSMTTAIDRLQKRSLVERRNQPEDRRTRVIHLTPEGRKLIKCAFAAHSGAMNKLGEALTEEERGDTIRLLKELGTAAEQQTVAR